MNDINNNNPLAARQRQQISVKDTTEVVCEKCQHNIFQMGTYLRKISPILTGTGKPGYYPIEGVAFYCVKCGHVNDEFVPQELKKESLIKIA